MPCYVKESQTLNSFKRKIQSYDFDYSCRLCRLYIGNLGFYSYNIYYNIIYYMCQSFESQTWLSGKIFVESVLESEQQQVTKGLKAPPPLSLKRQNLSQ